MPKATVRVLLLEDSLTDTLLLQDALKRDQWADYQITTARLLKDGLALLSQDIFDIVLLDPGLTDSHGLDTFQKVFQHAPKVPIVILSGLDDEQVAMQSVQSGAQDYLVKGDLAWQMIGRAIRYAIERQQTQRILQTNETRFRTMLNHSADAIGLIAADGSVQYVGNLSGRLLGYDPVPDLNRIITLVHEEDKDAINTIIDLVRQNPGFPFTGQFRAKHADGSWRWIEITGNNLINDPGIEAMVVNYREITQRKQAEEELRLARFSLDHTGEVVLWIDASGLIIDANLFAERALGYARSELLSKNIADIDRTITPQRWATDWEEMRKERIRVLESIHITKAGLEIPVEMTIYSLTYNGRELQCTFSRDITARRKTAEALERSERKFRGLFENAPIGMFRLELASGRVIDINSKALEILGYSLDQIEKWQVSQIWPTFEDYEKINTLLESKGRLIDQETVLNTRDGLKHCLISAVAYPADDILEGTLQDISQRKQAEEALHKRTEELSLLLEAGRELSSTLDIKQVYLILKKHIERVVPCDTMIVSSYTPEDELLHCDFIFDETGEIDTTGFPPIPLEPPGHGTQSLVIRSGKSLLMSDYEQQRRTATNRYYFTDDGALHDHVPEEEPRARSAILVPLTVENQVTGVLQIFSVHLHAHNEDHLRFVEALAFRVSATLANAVLFNRLQAELAERSAAEDRVRQMNSELERRILERTSDLSRANAELERTARAKDEFLANMSHELRTPLNAILTLTESLEEGIYEPVHPRQLKPLHTIAESGHHLLNLINDILDLSKIAAGRLELHCEWIDANNVCEASLRMVRQIAQKKNQQVSIRIDPAAGRIFADQRCLKQMLVNLLSNAVKFTPNEGSFGIEVTANPEQGQSLITVWDTGIGISPENFERLFMPFVQLDTGLARQFGGTGLGLPLVYRMAELHQGSISVSSELSKGSRFTLALPLPELPKEITGAFSYTMPVVGKRTALLVDESTTTTDQLTRYLNELEMYTHVATSGKRALELAQDLHPDLILLDVLQRDISGWQVLEALKSDPDTADIPVIVISVVDEPARAISLGAVDAILKPIARTRLIEALAKALPQNAPSPEASAECSGLILLAEDHIPNQITYTDYLTSKGYQVVLASNGNEALQRAVEKTPNIILMDIQMPGMDGLEAIRRLRSIPALQRVPIIALTALAMPGDRERCLAIGANEYMSKPVSLKYLLQLIGNLINANEQ